MRILYVLLILMGLYFVIEEIRVGNKFPAQLGRILLIVAGISIFLYGATKLVRPNLDSGLLNDMGVLTLLSAFWGLIDLLSYVRLERLRKQGKLSRASIYQRIFHRKYIEIYTQNGKKPKKGD